MAKAGRAGDPPDITLEYAIRKKDSESDKAEDDAKAKTSTFPPTKEKGPTNGPAAGQ